jgi:hypothetical protein
MSRYDDLRRMREAIKMGQTGQTCSGAPPTLLTRFGAE